MTRWYYICDACGNLANVTDAPLADDCGFVCDGCGSAALWEFTNKKAALEHSEHIRRLVRSRLFRRVGA